MVIPDLFQQHGAGDRLSAVAHEEFQQLKFPRLQVDLDAAAVNLAGDQVHFQIADLQPRLDGPQLAPSGQRLHRAWSSARAYGLTR